MCASVWSSLLLLTLTIAILSGTMMTTEGLPLGRQERGVDRGVLAGADFLSVFMSSSLREAYRETTTPEPTTTEESYTRSTRSANFLTNSPIAQTTTPEEPEDNTSLYTTISAQLHKLDGSDKQSSDSNSLNEGVVVAVSVSSSVGRTINKEIEDTTVRETTTEYPDQHFVASEEHPSLVAEANKSEFSVEESEPITTNRDISVDFSYPARIQALPHQNSAINPNSDFIAQFAKDKLQPIHQTVIYHNSPRDPARARSVSYSTVIQAVPHPHNEKQWDEENNKHHERRERHYEGAQVSFNNDFHQQDHEKMRLNHTLKPFQSSEEIKFVTSVPLKSESNWEKPEESYTPNPTTRRNTLTTERNWEMQEKPYVPTVYGRPEQNYEVDESASVMTNGRVHGVQPSPTVPSKQEVKIGESKKTDDSQKVGYVVEGRNYRKYRVEERTSDGFIVGEYGVVSHDDGSLRGVRYTADGTISPRLIHDALMKFLSL